MNYIAKTIEDVLKDKNLYYHHTDRCIGYKSRRGNGYVEEYKGKYGEGYKIIYPRWDNNQYVDAMYFIKKNKKI